MRRRQIGRVVVSIVGVAAFGILAASASAQLSRPAHTATPPAGAASWAMKGVSVLSSSPATLGRAAFRASVREAQRDGANTVSLVVQYDQPTLTSARIHATSTTPTHSALRSAISYIHARGLRVAVKVFFDVTPTAKREAPWRWNIDPTNRAAWFRNATTLEVKLAHLEPDILIVGTEMGKLTAARIRGNTAGWIHLISTVRKVFTGVLTYEANTPSGPPYGQEAQDLRFWPYLDFVSLSGYNALQGPGPCDATAATLERAWASIERRYYAPLERELDKPIVFGEAGYSSLACDARYPYKYKGNITDPVLDLSGQANAYQAFLDFWARHAYVHGVLWWNWLPSSTAGGAHNLDYTPQNKPAERVMRAAFDPGAGAVSTTSSTTTTSTAPTTATTSLRAATWAHQARHPRSWRTQDDRERYAAVETAALKAVPEIHWSIHRAFTEYQRVAEDRRQLAADIGELVAKLVAGKSA